MQIFTIKKLFNSKIKTVTIILILFLIVFRIYNRFYTFNKKYNYLSNLKTLNLEIINKKDVTEDKISYLVEYNGDKFILNFYRDEKEISQDFYEKYNYSPMDVITAVVKLGENKKLNNPDEFDYKKYLNSNNIVGVLNVYGSVTINTKVKIKQENKITNLIINKLKKCLLDLKEHINKKLEKNLDNRHMNFFKSIIYSDDLFLDEDISKNFKECGASFMLTTSGTHVIAILYVMNLFFTKESKTKDYIISIFLIIFTAFVGFKISVIRAVLSKVLGIVFKRFGINLSNIKRLFITFAIMISYNFYYIFNSAFILSFSSVLSIIIFSNLINSYLKRVVYMGRMKKYAYLKSNLIPIVLNFFIDLISINISVIIGTFPIQINLFHEINILSFIFNIPLSIFCSFEYILGFLSIFLSFIPLICDMLALANFTVLEIIIKLADILSKNSLKLIIPNFNLLEIILYYISLLIIIFKIYLLKKYPKQKRKNLNKVLNINLACFIIFIVLSGIYKIHFKSYVIFFNVGQGNMALIKQNKNIVVIDSGSTTKKTAANILENYIKCIGKRKIDLLLITHFHSDHTNGIYNMSNDISIANIAYLKPAKEFEVDSEYELVKEYIVQNNVTSIELANKDYINLGKININAFIPENLVKASDIANANSVIYLISVNNKKFLFMGDATKETEKYYLDMRDLEILENIKNVDIYQVGHHGSKTSTSKEFLKLVNPEKAVISSKKKVYSHPSKETLDTLENLKITYYITEKNGAIIFK